MTRAAVLAIQAIAPFNWAAADRVVVPSCSRVFEAAASSQESNI